MTIAQVQASSEGDVVAPTPASGATAKPKLLSRAKQLAYYASTALLRWHYRRNWGMTVGEGVRIARTAKMDKTNPRGVKIGDYTCITFGATILTHDFINGRDLDVVIGSHCFIGARSIIMPGVTIGDHCVVGPGSVVMTDVPDNTVVFGNPARVVERGIVTGKWGIRMPEFLKLEGIELPVKSVAAKLEPVREAPAPRQVQVRAPASDVSADELIRSYLPQVSDPSKTFDDLGVDSFTLVTLRAEIEETERSTIADDAWTQLERPIDLLPFITRPKQGQAQAAAPAATARRRHEITLPQMANGSISEGWLFKEAGDVHWSMLADGLRVKTREMVDARGERIFPTFTRLRFRSDAPLSLIRENDLLDIDARMSRYGPGLYFSRMDITAGSVRIDFEAMSGFTKYGERPDNTALQKSQPEIPSDFGIPAIAELPEFAKAFNEARALEPAQTLFETEHQIVPQYEINGVGMLYCASYPVTTDIGVWRYLGAEEATRWSPVERDVVYLGNSNPDDRLIFRLHEDERVDGERRLLSSISRGSDGKRIAIVRSALRPRR